LTARLTTTPAGRGGSSLVGDVLFEVASLSRRLGIDPELALRTRALAFRDRIVSA
jgi:NTP pyrophosphatase (non-canonical NTP hydrolase)